MQPKTVRSLALLALLLPLLVSSVASSLTGEVAAGTHVYIVGEATVPALAVAELQNGTMIGSIGNITVRVLYPGSGRVYVSTEPLSDVDMQASVRAAVLVASFYAGRNPLEYDFLVSIKTGAPLVGGPSASSAIAAAVYLALTGGEPVRDVASTGMILPDGTIGPVGGIPYKVQVAIENGYTTVLVPLGQSTYTETTYERVQVGRVSVVRPVTVTWNVTELAAKLGGRVVEVATAFDVIRGFTGASPLPEKYSEPWVTEEELTLVRREFEAYVSEALATQNNVSGCATRLGQQALRTSVEGYLNLSQTYLADARRMWERGLYYPALSFAFVSSFYATSALFLCEAARSTTPTAYLSGVASNLLEDLAARWGAYSNLYRNRTRFTIGELFVLSEVYDRLRDAEEASERARSYIASGDYASASLSLGYLWGRIRSVDFWLRLYEVLRDHGNVAKEIEAERLVSLILSYSYMAVSYLEALASATGVQEQNYSYLYETLSEASSLILEGNYPGALSLAMNVLAETTIAMQELYSLNTSAVVDVLSRHARLILANTPYAPTPARFYVMYADVYKEAGEARVALSYYERGLVILHATGMAMVHVTREALDGEVTVTPEAPLGDQTTRNETQATPSTTSPEEVKLVRPWEGWGKGLLLAATIMAVAVILLAYRVIGRRQT